MSDNGSENGETVDLEPVAGSLARASEKPLKQLGTEEFRSVLEKVSALGLTWTAELPPRITAKEELLRSSVFGEEYRKIQEQYPAFPHELFHVLYYALTGRKDLGVESDSELDAKASVLQELLITPEFRGEFFFKHAIKVPYFVDLDWEIVIKAFERGVHSMPRIPYALLALEFRDSDAAEGSRKVTVAVNAPLIDRLLKSLEEAKLALHRAQAVANSLASQDKEQ
ncbi:MAG TPA: hypothetical protein VJX67_18585 [Blastocatellia bacterium]|nr:hypothetical protein [Blastocatellia bacterium]